MARFCWHAEIYARRCLCHGCRCSSSSLPATATAPYTAPTATHCLPHISINPSKIPNSFGTFAFNRLSAGSDTRQNSKLCPVAGSPFPCSPLPLSLPFSPLLCLSVVFSINIYDCSSECASRVECFAFDSHSHWHFHCADFITSIICALPFPLLASLSPPLSLSLLLTVRSACCFLFSVAHKNTQNSFSCSAAAKRRAKSLP